MRATLLFLIILLFSIRPQGHSQNIIGLRIMIGEDAPAFLAFPSEVENVRWDNNEMNNYYKISTRNENTIQISYNGQDGAPTTGTGFSVIQGKNTHLFTLVLKKDYDINKDPVLYYDFSDKGKLKAAVEMAKKDQAGAAEPPALAAADKSKAEDRKREMHLVQQQKQKEAETQQKTEREAEQKREAELAKAKEEARQKEKEELLVKEKEKALRKEEAEAEKRKQAELDRLRREQEAENKKAALAAAELKKKQEQEQDEAAKAEAIARHKAAEEKRLQQQQEKERLAQEKLAAQEAERLRKAEELKKETEARRKAKEEAEARLAALVQAKEDGRKQEAYSMAGLYNRYGKGPNGINFYDIPPEQYNLTNTDFYIAADTATNCINSIELLKESPRLDLRSKTAQNISASLLGISFKNAFAYYHIRITNNSNEDYLVGANSLAWYQPDGKAKYLKCSYLTYIGFFPIVKPGTTGDYMYVTRAANINEEDKLIFNIAERRSEKPKLEIFFDGSDYLKEQARIQKAVERSATSPERKKRGK